MFTGDEFGEGAAFIDSVLKKKDAKASFFLTGRFYTNPLFQKQIEGLRKHGHYLGPHSDQHLLYCDWTKRDSLLVTRKQFMDDLDANYRAMKKLGIGTSDARYFLPPYEWYNDSIASWTTMHGQQLVNFSPGTRSNADYTTEKDRNYRSSEEIYRSIVDFELRSSSGLNGFILLLHIGVGPGRKDKFYYLLPKLIDDLKTKGYHFQRIDELLSIH